jgi:hypothetical protein
MGLDWELFLYKIYLEELPILIRELFPFEVWPPKFGRSFFNFYGEPLLVVLLLSADSYS